MPFGVQVKRKEYKSFEEQELEDYSLAKKALEQVFDDCVTQATTQYDRWDITLAYIDDNGIMRKAMVEVKQRFRKYDDWQIECKKFHHLQWCKAYHFDEAYYLVIYENEYYLWRIDNINIRKMKDIEFKCPKTSSGDSTKVMKPCFLLPSSWAIKGYISD